MSSYFNNIAAGVQWPPPVCISKLKEQLDNRPLPGRTGVIQLRIDAPDGPIFTPIANNRQTVRPNDVAQFAFPFTPANGHEQSALIGNPTPGVETPIIIALVDTIGNNPPVQTLYQAFMPAKPIKFPQDSGWTPVYNSGLSRVGELRAWIG